MKADDIGQNLAARNYLSECLLQDVRWGHHRTVVTLVFNDVWNADRSAIRDDVLEVPRLVVLKASGVLSFHLDNQLTGGMLLQPELMDWGMDEVAVVTVEEREDREITGEVFNVGGMRVRWEGGRELTLEATDIAWSEGS